MFRDAVLQGLAAIRAFSNGQTDEPWGWKIYSKKVLTKSRVKAGVRMEWLTQSLFIDFWKAKHNVTEGTAREQWFHEVQTLSKGRVNSDKSEILYPTTRYVDVECVTLLSR